MRKLIFVFTTFILIGCNMHKNDKVIFISLLPEIKWDSLGVPQIVVRQYAEFSLSSKNNLIISKSEDMYEVDNMDIPKYDLDSFSYYKVNDSFVKSMTKLIESNYKKSYRRTLGKNDIDDRNMDFIIIIRDNLFKIIPYEHDYLPEELKQIDDSIDKYLNSTSLIQYKFNHSIETISRLQDSLFKRLPPPPRPLRSTIKFTSPIINDKKEK
ncbi:MAG TPA: hypothetical protein VI413_06525 [Paludibacter sp.]